MASTVDDLPHAAQSLHYGIRFDDLLKPPVGRLDLFVEELEHDEQRLDLRQGVRRQPRLLDATGETRRRASLDAAAFAARQGPDQRDVLGACPDERLAH